MGNLPWQFNWAKQTACRNQQGDQDLQKTMVNALAGKFCMFCRCYRYFSFNIVRGERGEKVILQFRVFGVHDNYPRIFCVGFYSILVAFCRSQVGFYIILVSAVALCRFRVETYQGFFMFV